MNSLNVYKEFKAQLIIFFASVILCPSINAKSITDFEITITGNLHMVPCVVNDNNMITVDFKKVNINNIEDASVLTQIPVSCSPYTSVFAKILGDELEVYGDTYENILKATLQSNPAMDGFGIRLWQGDFAGVPLVLGLGHENQYGYPLTTGVSNSSNGSFTFTFFSTLYVRDNEPLEAGTFSAHATLDIFYF